MAERLASVRKKNSGVFFPQGWVDVSSAFPTLVRNENVGVSSHYPSTDIMLYYAQHMAIVLYYGPGNPSAQTVTLVYKNTNYSNSTAGGWGSVKTWNFTNDCINIVYSQEANRNCVSKVYISYDKDLPTPSPT